jgi:hypothetical protein
MEQSNTQNDEQVNRDEEQVYRDNMKKSIREILTVMPDQALEKKYTRLEKKTTTTDEDWEELDEAVDKRLDEKVKEKKKQIETLMMDENYIFPEGMRLDYNQILIDPNTDLTYQYVKVYEQLVRMVDFTANLFTNSAQSVSSDPEEDGNNFTLEVPIINNKGEVLQNRTKTYSGLTRDRYNLLRYMHLQCPELSRYPTTGTKTSLLHNYTQAGKTVSYMYRILLSLVFDRNVFVSVLNLREHNTQLQVSMADFYKKLEDAGREHGFTVPRMVPMSLGHNSHKEIKDEMIRGGAVIIGLDNAVQLNNLLAVCKSIKKADTRPLDAIVDESDNPIKSDATLDNALRDTARKEVFARVALLTNVTATPGAHYLKHGNLITKHNLICAPVPEDYVGYGHDLLRIVRITDGIGNYCGNKAFEEGVFAPPPWFIPTVDKHLNLPSRSTGENHDLVFKMADIQENQRAIREFLENYYPNNPSIVINSHSVDVYIPGLREPLDEWFPNSGYTVEGCVHRWAKPDKFSYSQMKDMVRDQLLASGITTCYFEIIGIQAGRGLRLKTSDHRWMPSGFLYMDKDSVAFDVAYQASGRIHGRRGIGDDGEMIDGDVKYLYTTSAIDRILQYCFTANERFSRENDMSEDSTMEEVLKGIPLVKAVANTQMAKAFKIKIQLDKVSVEVVPATAQQSATRILGLRNNVENAIRNGKNTILIKIFRYMKGHSEASKKDIEANCDIECFNHYTQWNTHGRYKILIPTTGNFYQINEEVQRIAELTY